MKTTIIIFLVTIGIILLAFQSGFLGIEKSEIKEVNTTNIPNRDQVLSDITEAYNNKNYIYALHQSEKFLRSGSDDKEIYAVYEKSKMQVKKQIANKGKLTNKQEIKRITTELKSIPASNFQKNILLYKQLTKLDPLNKRFKSKLQHYIKIRESKSIQVLSDFKAKYYLLEKSGTRNKPVTIITRIGPSGISYTKKQFNCKNKTFVVVQ